MDSEITDYAAPALFGAGLTFTAIWLLGLSSNAPSSVVGFGVAGIAGLVAVSAAYVLATFGDPGWSAWQRWLRGHGMLGGLALGLVGMLGVFWLPGTLSFIVDDATSKMPAGTGWVVLGLLAAFALALFLVLRQARKVLAWLTARDNTAKILRDVEDVLIDARRRGLETDDLRHRIEAVRGDLSRLAPPKKQAPR